MNQTKIEINLNPIIPPLPRIDDKTKINVRYTLISPYASVHIYWDKEEGELRYNVEEPILDQQEKSILSTLETSLGEMININILVQKDSESMIDYIDKIKQFIENFDDETLISLETISKSKTFLKGDYLLKSDNVCNKSV